MNFIAALPALVSAIGSINNANAGRSQARRGQKRIDDSINDSTNAFQRVQKELQDARARGDYNSARQTELDIEGASKALELALGNDSARQANMGYGRGDSPMEQRPRIYSDRAKLELSQRTEDNRNQYRQMEQSDEDRVAAYLNQLNSLRMGAGANDVAQGTARAQAGYQGLAGTAVNTNWSSILGKTAPTPPVQGPQGFVGPPTAEDYFTKLTNSLGRLKWR